MSLYRVNCPVGMAAAVCGWCERVVATALAVGSEEQLGGMFPLRYRVTLPHSEVPECFSRGYEILWR